MQSCVLIEKNDFFQSNMTFLKFQATLYATKCGRHLSKLSRVTASRIKFEIRSVDGWNFEYDSINDVRTFWPQKSPTKFKFSGKIKGKFSSALKLFLKYNHWDLNDSKLIRFLIFSGKLWIIYKFVSNVES